ncbi:MAG: hypothetical protein PHF45_02280 [Candidatus Pacebacteria bacterium]|nr:hypothetical protein [Candidatus Paceibacterota bacterium]
MAQETSNLYKIYQAAHRDRTLFVKKSLLAIAIIVCFGLGSVFFSALLNDFSTNMLILAIVFWTIGVSLLPVFFLVIPISSFLLWDLAISIAPFLHFLFKGQWHPYLFGVWGIAFLLLLLSRASMKGESSNLLDIKWGRIVSKGSFQMLLIVVVVLIALIYFQNKGGQIEQVGGEILETAISKSEKVQNIFGIKLSGTVDEILKSYIEKQMSSLNNGMEQETTIVNKTLLTEMKSSFSKFLGMPLTGEEKLSSLMMDWIKIRWQTLSSLLKMGLVFIVVLLLLGILRFINIFFSITLVLTSWILLQILLSVKYLAIKRVGVEKQEITIS